jgi:hypothetical protein
VVRLAILAPVEEPCHRRCPSGCPALMDAEAEGSAARGSGQSSPPAVPGIRPRLPPIQMTPIEPRCWRATNAGLRVNTVAGSQHRFNRNWSPEPLSGDQGAVRLTRHSTRLPGLGTQERVVQVMHTAGTDLGIPYWLATCTLLLATRQPGKPPASHYFDGDVSTRRCFSRVQSCALELQTERHL